MNIRKGSSFMRVAPNRSDTDELAHPVEALTFSISGSPVVIYLFNADVSGKREKATFQRGSCRSHNCLRLSLNRACNYSNVDVLS